MKTFLFTILFSTIAFGATLHDVTLPDDITLDGKKLVLNGLGVRAATFLNIKVYVAGLYLPKKESDAKKVLESSDPKQIKMSFIREVEAKDMEKAWKKSLDENCKSDCEKFKPKIDILNSYMEDVKKGETMTYNFLPDRLEVWMKEKKKGDIQGSDFVRLILATWLGENPPNRGLKMGMLGLEP